MTSASRRLDLEEVLRDRTLPWPLVVSSDEIDADDVMELNLAATMRVAKPMNVSYVCFISG